MEYGLRRRRPVIRSYPMETGSIVVVSAQKKNVTFTLLRENQKDVLQTGFMRRRTEALEHIWRALLSTAPIPRMSDEELIG